MEHLPSPSTTKTATWYRAFHLAQSLNAGSKRIHWSNTQKFLLSSIGYTVGLANAWRFPYAAFKCGSGGFFYAYLILIFLAGLPVLYLECLLGQFTGCNPMDAFNFTYISQGVGVTMVLLSFFLGLYFIIFMVYPIKYFFMSFDSILPWSTCGNEKSRHHLCLDFTNSSKHGHPLCTTLDDTSDVDCFETPAHYFWERSILLSVENDVRYSLFNAGTVNWNLFFVLIFCWALVFICTIQGIKSSTKVVYVTSTIPLVILFVMMILSASQDGSSTGLKAFFIPDWEQLKRPIVWCEAATQVFLSFGLGVGGQILHYGYKNMDDEFLWHLNFLAACNVVAALACSITVYSMLGILARILETDIKNVIEIRPDLAFIIVPDALSYLPLPNVWCLLYFLMVFFMALGPQFIFVDVVAVTIQEQIPLLGSRGAQIRICVCFCSFLLSISCVIQAGIYVIEFFDTYLLTICLLWIAFFEVFFLAYIYGVRLFFLDVNFMLGHLPSKYLSIFWFCICPCTLLVILGLAFYNVIIKYSQYPAGFSILGWSLLTVILLQIPLWAIYNVWTRSKSNDGWGGCLKPRPRWGPRDVMSKIIYLTWKQQNGYPMAENSKRLLSELRSQSNVIDQKAIITTQVDEKSVFRRYGALFHRDEIETLKT